MYYKTFDTHKYIKSLQETGFNEKQAEILVKSLIESRDFDLSTLATREQINNVESKLSKDIADVESKLSKDIANVRTDLQKEIIDVKDQVKEIKGEVSKNKYDIIKWMVTLFVTTLIAIYLKR